MRYAHRAAAVFRCEAVRPALAAVRTIGIRAAALLAEAGARRAFADAVVLDLADILAHAGSRIAAAGAFAGLSEHASAAAGKTQCSQQRSAEHDLGLRPHDIGLTLLKNEARDPRETPPRARAE